MARISSVLGGPAERHYDVKSPSDSRSVVSDSFTTPWTVPARLLCPWDSPGKNTGVGCHSLPRGSFWPRDQTQVSHVAGRQTLYHLRHQGSYYGVSSGYTWSRDKVWLWPGCQVWGIKWHPQVVMPSVEPVEKESPMRVYEDGRYWG